MIVMKMIVMKMIVMSEFRYGKSNFHWCSTTDFIKKCTYYAIKVIYMFCMECDDQQIPQKDYTITV